MIGFHHVETRMRRDYLLGSSHLLLLFQPWLLWTSKRRWSLPCVHFLWSLPVWRILNKNWVPVFWGRVATERLWRLLPMLCRIYARCCHHSISSLPGSRGGAGLRSCIDDSWMPCSNLEVHKVRTIHEISRKVLVLCCFTCLNQNASFYWILIWV